VVLRRASRATVFPSPVPGVTLPVGFIALGDVPSPFQTLDSRSFWWDSV
jgi:hypothetical protein